MSNWINDGHAVELVQDDETVIWIWHCPVRQDCTIAAWLGLDIATAVRRPAARTVIPAFPVEYRRAGGYWVWRPVERPAEAGARLSSASGLTHEEEPMPDTLTGTTSTAEDRRNLSLNPFGDPAREKEFLDGQEVTTAEGGRASVPQAILPDSTGLVQSIREADVTDTEVEAPGYEAPDAPVGEAAPPSEDESDEVGDEEEAEETGTSTEEEEPAPVTEQARPY